MKNSNDITSKYYDIVSSPFKGEQVTAEEISLIKSVTKTKGKILDIGCGTGRHFLALEHLGFQMTGIDMSEGMLEVLKSKKLKENRVINADILEFDFFNVKFDAIIMFWNAFNEICTTREMAEKLFSKMTGLLALKGYILINSDDPESNDPNSYEFSTQISDNSLIFDYSWNKKLYDPKEKLSTSLEKISVKKGSEIIETFESEINQKWYSESEYEELGVKNNLKMLRHKIKSNNELYLQFTK